MAQFAVSPYKMLGFYQCAKWYHFEYVDQMISAYKRELRKPRSFLTVGDCVHKTLKKLMSLSQEERSQEKANELLEQIWKPYSGKRGGFESGEEEEGCFQEAKLMVKNFLEKQAQMKEPFYIPPLDSYEELKKVEMTSEIVLQGKIDRVDQDEGGLQVIDYKTSKSEEEDPFQIFAYALMVEEIFSRKVSKASFWYLRSNHIKTFLFDEEEKRKVVQRVEKFVEEVNKESNFSPRVGLKCYVCDYINFCPEKEKVLELISGKKTSKKEDFEKEISELPF